MLNPDLIFETYLSCLSIPQELLKSKVQYTKYLEELVEEAKQIIAFDHHLQNFSHPNVKVFLRPLITPMKIHLRQVKYTLIEKYDWDGSTGVNLQIPPEARHIFRNFDIILDGIDKLIIPIMFRCEDGNYSLYGKLVDSHNLSTGVANCTITIFGIYELNICKRVKIEIYLN